jgi:hypothetical protein
MAWPGFPAFPSGETGNLPFKLGPWQSCKICKAIPFDRLPDEVEDGYKHQNLETLYSSMMQCPTCALIYWAAGCSLVDYGGIGGFQPLRLSSGIKVTARWMGSMYDGLGLRGFENGAGGISLSGPAIDHRPPLQVDLKRLFPGGTVMQGGETETVRVWLFANWYKSGLTGNQTLQLIGLGVRLGTSEKIEDAVTLDGAICGREAVVLRGSYLRVRTDSGKT